MKNCLSAGVLALVVAIPMAGVAAAQEGGDAQPGGEEVAVVLAAAGHVAEGLRRTGEDGEPRRIILDPAVPTRGLTGFDERRPRWGAAVLERLADTLGVPIGNPAAHHVCGGTDPLSPCRLKGVDAILSFGRPELDGDTATIAVRMVYRSPAMPDPDGAWRTTTVHVLERIDGEWAVTGFRYISVT